jgi:hypothetical protein
MGGALDDAQLPAEIYALAGSSPLPIPVGGRELAGSSPPRCYDVLGSSPPVELFGTSPRREPCAPYQALPVTAQCITEHLTPALQVIDGSTMTPEVRANAPPPPRARNRRRRRARARGRGRGRAIAAPRAVIARRCSHACALCTAAARPRLPPALRTNLAPRPAARSPHQTAHPTTRKPAGARGALRRGRRGLPRQARDALRAPHGLPLQPRL